MCLEKRWRKTVHEIVHGLRDTVQNISSILNENKENISSRAGDIKDLQNQ